MLAGKPLLLVANPDFPPEGTDQASATTPIVLVVPVHRPGMSQ